MQTVSAMVRAAWMQFWLAVKALITVAAPPSQSSDTTVTIEKSGASILTKDYKIVGEFPPVRVSIDVGSGPTNIDFAIDGTAIWTMSIAPPIALSLRKDGA